MSAEPPLRKRKQSRVAPGLDPTPSQVINKDKDLFEWTQEIHPTLWESFKLGLRRLKTNFWPNLQYFMNDHPILVRILNGITVFVTIGIFVVLLLFRPNLEPRFKTLSPWHVELHNAWLRDHGIRESTWILDEEAQTHTSNDPSLVKEVLLQFPQRNGGSSIELRNVHFDPKAHYGVISMKKLEEDHVPMRTLFGIGERTRPVMGVEVIGRDIVAMIWGDKGTYILKAWTLTRCETGFFRPYPYCALLALWNWNNRLDIPAETMKELVDKHRIVPASADADADETEEEEATPWRQRALDEETDIVQKEKKTKKGFWGL